MFDATLADELHADRWLVVWTKSRAEKRVAFRLVEQGIEAWVPTITQRRRWSDRWRDVILPAFPGYLFARGDAGALHRLLRTPGVMTVVKDGKKPATLSGEFVGSLRWMLESSGVPPAPVTAGVDFTAGDEVMVREGPLAGRRGVIQAIRNERSLVVRINAIGRGIAFSIGTALVSRLEPGRGDTGWVPALGRAVSVQ